MPFDSWATLDWVAFDTETTGTDVRSDRIVTACLVELGEKGVADERAWLVNPEIDIPDSAAEVHGITTEVAQRDGQDYSEGYAELRDALETAWANDKCVIAYNGSFDLSVIHFEGLRLGYPALQVGTMFDPFVVWRALEKYRKGKRRLEDACQRFQVSLDGAHDATEDALAAARVAWRMLHAEYTGQLAAMSTTDLMKWQADQHELRQLDFQDYLRRNGKDPSDVSTAWPLQV